MADCQTYAEAVANAEVVIDEWIETARKLGRPIPSRAGSSPTRERDVLFLSTNNSQPSTFPLSFPSASHRTIRLRPQRTDHGRGGCRGGGLPGHPILAVAIRQSYRSGCVNSGGSNGVAP
jgi:hypothetical protein